ncbi:mCG1039039 [Mus musculus]|nr:mCG1039039 [Mus musculus]
MTGTVVCCKNHVVRHAACHLCDHSILMGLLPS